MTEQQGNSGDPISPPSPPTYTPPPADPPPPDTALVAPPGEGARAPGLEPGRGAPLVAGPPRSVSEQIDAGKVNTVFGIGGVLGIVAIIIVVIVVGLLLISALSHR